MTYTTLTAGRIRELRESTRALRQRLGEQHEGFQQESVRATLQAVYERSADSQGIDFDSLTDDEADLLLLCLEQTVNRQLIAFAEQLLLSQQTAADN